ncbi:hypothetical protein V5N11_015561 [Cardamine amara subsp. amara]|uniref:Retrotransposon gag domain-containing protein n=1 Tax=Cardamine amara subsp. amara TaxID=228776 RepID=A0ABD0ZMJ6_CARAN
MENTEAPQDPNALLMQAITAMEQQLQRIVQRLDQMEQPPVNPRQAPPPRANGHGDDLDLNPEGEQPRVRRRGPRQGDLGDAEGDLPRHNHSQDMKLKAPTFAGRVDPEAFLEWEQRMEHIFAYYDYNEQKRLALAVAQLTDHALSWWDREFADRRRTQAPQVRTWREM